MRSRLRFVYPNSIKETKEKERERKECAREDPKINLSSELTRKGTCPIEVRPSAVFAGPYGSLRAPMLHCCCRCRGHPESARGGKCHRTRKQLLRSAGALGALWQPDALHLRLPPSLPLHPPLSSIWQIRSSAKHSMAESRMRKKSEREGRKKERKKEREREWKRERKRSPPPPPPRRSANSGPQRVERNVRRTNCADFYKTRELRGTCFSLDLILFVLYI